MRPLEALRGYFRVGDVPRFTPEELAEARILGEVLKTSGAPELLLVERQNRWGRVGEVIRAGELIRDGEEGGYRLETALAYPKRAVKDGIVVAVGAYRLATTGFGVYVASDGQRVFDGKSGDERLQIDLGRAISGVTLQMVRSRIL